eukprot:1363948-Pleurochrysis_carterae.AAC.1
MARRARAATFLLDVPDDDLVLSECAAACRRIDVRVVSPFTCMLPYSTSAFLSWEAHVRT